MNENEVIENGTEVATEAAGTVVETVSKTSSFWESNKGTVVGVGIAALACIAVYDHVAKPIYKICKKKFGKSKEEVIDAEHVEVTDIPEDEDSDEESAE